MNSSYSSNRPAWCKIASATRNLINSVPQTAATILAFSSVYIHPSSVVRVHRGQQEVYRSDTKHLLYSEQCTQYCKQKVYSTNNSNCLPMKKQLNCLWSYNCLQNGVHLIEIDMRYLHQYMLLAAGRMNFLNYTRNQHEYPFSMTSIHLMIVQDRKKCFQIKYIYNVT